MIKQDPVEQTPEYLAIQDELEVKIKIRIALSDSPVREGMMGYCHSYWRWKKIVLCEDYGIDWKSPAELNPDVLFD